MTVYKAPLSDLSFVLQHLVDFDQICASKPESDANLELASSVLEEAASLAENEFAPLNQSGDQHGVTFADRAVSAAPGFSRAYGLFQEAGWLGLAVEDQYGGQGLPFALHMAVSELWNSANLSLALCPMLSMGAIEALVAHANKDIQHTYLPKLVSGEWTGTMNLTEPQAGSNLAAVKTKAVAAGDSFRITGQKIFISWGDHDMTENILHLVLARLPDAPAGVKGLSLFLVPKFLLGTDGSPGERNDAYAVSIEHKMGIHASPTCVMSFGESDNSAGAVGYLIGERNQGIACMFTMMNHARLEVGLEGVGISERALQAATGFAFERRQGAEAGSSDQPPIIAHGDVRRMLLNMRALTEAGRALCLVAAATLDRAHDAQAADRPTLSARLGLLTPLVKGWCTELAQEVTSLAVQVYGGMGYVEETGVAQYFRDVRITPIYEGTNGIQSADFIGRKFLRNGGKAMHDLAAEIESDIVRLSDKSDATLERIAKAMHSALGAHRKTCADLLSRSKDDPTLASAKSYDFMMMSGYLVGGWLMARSASAVAEVRTSGDRFLERKLRTCLFYAESVLPRVQYFGQLVSADNAVVTESDAELFRA